MSEFYERYIYLCARHHKSPSAVANEIGLSSAAATGWKRGKDPSEVTIIKLAQYFDVSVSYLKGEKEESENPAAQEGNGADPVTMELLSMVNNASDEERQVMLEMLRLLKAQRGKG